MSSVDSAGNIETLLQRIGESGALPDSYAADPGSLFLTIHDQWVENGGTVAGKTRNSIRNLMDMLEAAGTQVPSLRSKLNGETRLRQGDAVALLDTYFSHWRVEASDDGDQLEYHPLNATNLKQAHRVILQSLFGNQKAVLLPKIEKDRKGKSRNIDVEPSDSSMFLAGRDVMLENFRSSRAAIMISRVGSVAGPTTATAIRGFCRIINDFWRIFQEDKLERILIWAVDPGDRDIENDDSLAAFANSEQLATFFRAVRLLRDPEAEARWMWLSTHSVVLVGSMDTAAIDQLYAADAKRLAAMANKEDVSPRGIKHSHFLLDTSPPSWLRSLQFAQLYGHELEDLEQSSFMLWLDQAETRWRYFGYAPASSPILGRDGTPSFTKFLELNSPGPLFDRAAAIIHAGACFRLSLLSHSSTEEELLRSIVMLRHLDFAIFQLSEFLDPENLNKPSPKNLDPPSL